MELPAEVPNLTCFNMRKQINVLSVTARINVQMEQAPLILTVSIDTEGFQYFNSLRQKHFPPDRNFIDAHLTLFHALPNEQRIIDAVNELANRQSSFILQVKEPASIGKGVAFPLESAEIIALHRTLQSKWIDFISAQDRQKLWPHITIQNKVPLHESQKLRDELQKSFKPFHVVATGLRLWEYLNGPWKFVEESIFK
jgi:hypothetical protein